MNLVHRSPVVPNSCFQKPELMSQHDLFTTAILLAPAWYSDDVREEIALPLAPGDYKVTPGARWSVVSLKDGAKVYEGMGPVEIARAR